MQKILIRNIDIDRWKKTGDRVIVYGRRKTGKTFFVSKFTEWNEFFFVKRDGGIFDLKNFKEISYDYLKDLLLKERGRIVVDEFHRLPADFLDFLQAFSEKMKVTLITSTLWLSKKILGEGSPILGLFEEFKIDLADERDVIFFLSEIEGKELIDTAIYIREPWMIPLLKTSVYEDIPRILVEEKNTLERLIGEVFREEERELKKTYASILFAIALGKAKSSEISSHMYSRKLIQKDDPSLIQGYLKTLCNIGLIEKLQILNKKFDLYQHKSPVLDLYFYLDAKYGFSDIDLPEKEVKEVFMKKLPTHAEQFFRNLFSKIFGLKAGKIIEKDYDVDIVLHSFKRITAVGEVKWKKFVEKEEVRRTEEILSKFKAKRFIVVPSKDVLEEIPRDVKVIDVETIKSNLKPKSSKQFSFF